MRETVNMQRSEEATQRRQSFQSSGTTRPANGWTLFLLSCWVLGTFACGEPPPEKTGTSADTITPQDGLAGEADAPVEDALSPDAAPLADAPVEDALSPDAAPLTHAQLLALGESLLAQAGCAHATAPRNCPGTAPPAFALEDFQPMSAKYGQKYGLESFKGQPLILTMLTGW